MLKLLFAKSISMTLTLAFASLLALAPATAQKRIKFTPPTPPDPGNPTDRGQGAGRRGPCDEKYQGLTALVPVPYPNAPDDSWGLTMSDRPTVWFDVPTGIDAPVLAEWRLRNSMGQTISKNVFRISKTKAGVIGLQLPIKTPLAIGVYQWDLALYCSSSSDRSNDEFDIPVVRKGRIQRIAMMQPLQQDLAKVKTPLEQAILYAKYGIWYDSLTALATQMRSPKSQDPTISETWKELLQQQKLESHASAPVTTCCEFQKR